MGKSLSYTFGVDSSLEASSASGPSPVATSPALAQAQARSGGDLGISGADWEQSGVKGVEILSISGNSSAEIAGLHKGDVITEVNGKTVRSTYDFARVLAELEPGTRVSIAYLIRTQLGWMPKETAAVLSKAN